MYVQLCSSVWKYVGDDERSGAVHMDSLREIAFITWEDAEWGIYIFLSANVVFVGIFLQCII